MSDIKQELMGADDSNSERVGAINDAIVSGVGFLMITVDALDADGAINVNYKRVRKEDVVLLKIES